MKLEVKYGLIMGLLTIIWVAIEFYLSSALNRPDLGIYTGALAVIIPVIIVFYSLRERKKLQGGKLTLKEAVKTGFFISLIAGVINALFIYIYISAQPEVMDNYLEYVRQNMLTAGDSEEAIKLALEPLKQSFGPRVQAAYFLISTVLSGTVISLVIGWFLNKKINARPALKKSTKTGESSPPSSEQK